MILAKAKTAYVFKTMVDPFIGKYSFVKVCSGVLKGDDILYNADADAEEKPGKIYTMCGNKPAEVSELVCRRYRGYRKTRQYKNGRYAFCKGKSGILCKDRLFCAIYIYEVYGEKNKGDEDKVSQALARMTAEDVTLKLGKRQ